MEIEILNERENLLLNRREIKFRVHFDSGIPKFQEIRKSIISKLKLNEKLTVMNGLKTEFGRKYADCYVKVYKDEESLKVEPKFRIKKNFEVETKKEEKEKEEKPESVKEKEEAKEEKKEKVEHEKEGEKTESKKEEEKAKEGEKKDKGNQNKK